MIFTESIDIINEGLFKKKSNPKEEAIKKIIPNYNTSNNNKKGTYKYMCYYVRDNVAITSVAGLAIEDIVDGNKSINDINKQFKTKEYPAYYIESLALISKSELNNHIKQAKYKTGDYYDFPDGSKLDPKKHFTTVIEDSLTMINYCLEDKICYCIDTDPDGGDLILDKISVDELYNCAKKCLDDYNRLIRAKSLNESYIEENVNMNNEVLCFSGNNGGSYIIEVSIGGKIREVIKQYNWKRKVKKRDIKAVFEEVTPYKRKEVHSKSELDKFYRNNDYCIECVSGDDELCQGLANILAVNFKINPPVEIYVISGKDMNKIYDLYGDNAYQDDVHHVIIPLNTVKSKDVIKAKYELNARYFNDVVDNNEYREYEAGRHKKSEQIQWIIDYYNESYTGGVNNMNNEVLCLSGNAGGSYIQDALYESYIQAKIDSEDRLAFALKESMIISEADYSNIKALHEARVSDKIKSKWKKFVAFIKGLIAKFMESMTNLLYNEKSYLEKYKEIILNKKPKDDMKYSYTGDYKEGINRLINTTVPLFDYTTYKSALEAEDNDALVKQIMNGKNFEYDDGVTLAEQFKSYFLVLDAGQKEGNFSDLNMTDMYNFCYNFNKIEEIVNKDLKRLEDSTRNIEKLINSELAPTNNNAAGDTVKDQNGGDGKPTGEATGNTGGDSGKTETPTVESEEESAIFTEADEQNKPASSGLKISSDPISKMGSTDKKDGDKEKDVATGNAAVAKSNNKNETDITNAANKWISVCNPLISAKLTACQQIAKDYMDIIRAHVRSYGGQSKSNKEGNQGAKPSTKYSKEAERAKQDAEKTSNDNGATNTPEIQNQQTATQPDKKKKGFFKRNK